MPEYWEIILRLVLSVILGGAIGIERAESNHDAGLRTHTLVCLGSAGIMLMSQAMASQFGGDIGRLGAQVISGIGFLGAGCILINGNKIKGLTTAAGLWATACVGLSVGMGYYFISVSVTVLMLAVMLLMRPIGNRLQNRAAHKQHELMIIMKPESDFNVISDYLTNKEIQVASLTRREEDAYVVKIALDNENEINTAICDLIKKKSVKHIEKID